jgi:hypothetical protein
MIPSIIFLLVLLLCAVVMILETLTIKYTFIFDFVKGFMIGALYNEDEYLEENLIEHTIQIALVFCTLSFIWETNNNNNSNNNYAS